jgi:hypothetical protein
MTTKTSTAAEEIIEVNNGLRKYEPATTPAKAIRQQFRNPMKILARSGGISPSKKHAGKISIKQKRIYAPKTHANNFKFIFIVNGTFAPNPVHAIINRIINKNFSVKK